MQPAMAPSAKPASIKQAHVMWWVLLTLALAAQIIVSLSVNGVQARWLNVPPAPSALSAAASALGDTQMAYRMYGVMLQNMGDFGGRVVSLKEYNYEALGTWFHLMDDLDPRSNYAPLLAAYYFGGADVSDDPQKLAPIVDYLRKVGNSAEGERWRWLAQAVYIARFKMKDLDKAMALAKELAANPNSAIPVWARNMDIIVTEARGDKEAAYTLIMEILKSKSDTLSPYEVNFMVYFMCQRVLDETQAAAHPLCKDVPRLPPEIADEVIPKVE